MMDEIWNTCRKYWYWLMVLMLSDILFMVFLWLVDAEGFFRLSCGLFLGTIGLFVLSMSFIHVKDKKKENLILEFLENPQNLQKERAVRLLKGREKELFLKMSSQLEERDEMIKGQKAYIQEYEEYMEGWAHEIKTPLALMTFLLDNRAEELGTQIHQRLEYVRSQMQEDIQRILYYARLNTAGRDYLFEKISLRECCRDVLKEYDVLLREHKFRIIDQVQDLYVVTDQKGLRFMLSQVISNSIKYADKEREADHITIYSHKEPSTKGLILGIRDNGMGVKPYDIPFLFLKGFTGDMGEQRRHATGMGLYLASRIGEDINIKMKVKEEYKEGFEILFLFPDIIE